MTACAFVRTGICDGIQPVPKLRPVTSNISPKCAQRVVRVLKIDTQ